MNPDSNRREFLGRAALSAISLAAGAAIGPRALAVEPFPRPGAARLKLSLAAYSFRQYFKDTSHPRETDTAPEKRIELFQFLDFCAEHGCQGVELTSYYFPANVTPEFLARVRRHAFLRGLDVSGTAVGNTFTHPAGPKRDEETAYVKRWIDHAVTLGAPHIRVFAGAAQRGSAPEEARRLCIAGLEECCAYAGARGIMLGLENHGGIVAEAEGLLAIVAAVKSPWLGINLDSGNFHTDDPYADFARCAPLAVNVQIKSELRRRGRPQNEAADLARFVKLLRDARYQGYVTLEYESAEDPFQAVPPLLKTLRGLCAG